MKIYDATKLNDQALQKLCRRQAINFDSVFPVVQTVLRDVKERGDRAVRAYEKKFGGQSSNDFLVASEEFEKAESRIPRATIRAFEQAATNIERFHRFAATKREFIETMPGVVCFAEMRPIEKVGLYVPGGTAPLPSTLLMLAIPARLAGCKEITVCTPGGEDGKVADIILYAAKLCGITSLFRIGGAQAIAAMAYSTQSVPKAYKIFGPGNQYVTAAKMLVSVDPDGSAIDMPAGPTEVLVIADKNARADFVAADLLAQAEHGADSQTILVCTDKTKTNEVLAELNRQLLVLPRQAIARQAIANSFALIVSSISEAVRFANQYAPEHLLLNVKKAEEIVPEITSAGSVFIGPYACESAGDYASGTNHSLPTYGYARTYAGVSVDSFQKRLTFQQITAKGAAEVGPIVARMAAEEGLDGHRRAMELRYKRPEGTL